MTVDTQVSLITFLHNLFTADPSMISLMGGTVRIYPVWAQVDAEFPYLVHRVDIKPRDIFPEQTSSYYLDIWFNCPDSANALAVRKRIIELIDELQFSTAEIANGKIGKVGDGFVPETEPDIWHYALQFSIKFYRKAETLNIIGR
jgi:hypothetical protein